MNQQVLINKIMLYGEGIEKCLDNNLFEPSLVLIYSAIDTVGWLNSQQKYASRKSFINWVENYLFVEKYFECTALELYAARCGMLHTLTASSRLSDNEQIRQICYVWGSEKQEDLCQRIIKVGLDKQLVAVHVDDLFEGWRLGVLKFMRELELTSSKKSIAYNKASLFLERISSPVLHGNSIPHLN